MSERFEKLVTEATDEVFATLMRLPYTHYLYFKPSTETEFGKMVAVPDEGDVPEGYKLACGDRIPVSLTRDGIRAWIHRLARRLPLMPYGD